MSRAIEVRADYTSGELRRLAQRTKNSAQARRLLAIAAVLEHNACEFLLQNLYPVPERMRPRWTARSNPPGSTAPTSRRGGTIQLRDATPRHVWSE